MRVLVTGAGGYIAEALIPILKKAGHYVIPMVRWDGAPHIRRNSEGRGDVELNWFADLAKGFGDLVKERPPEVVIHLAGRVEINLQPNPKGADLPPVPGPCDITALYRDNVLGTANVLQYCLDAKVKHLIFASTQAVYGMADRNEWGDLTIDPLEHYAASKTAAECIVMMGRRQGLMVSVLRLPGVFGDRRKGAVYNMCREALKKGEIHVTHKYPLPTNVMHIDDVAAALTVAASWQPPNDNWSEGMTQDISYARVQGGCSLSIVAAEIASLVPGCDLRQEGPEQPVLQIDGGLAQHLLNWHPKPRKERLAQVLEEIRRGS